ncbi:hypothetical protein AVEN_228425-1 [Araneus ventricosus]|uniref:Uncharacterized protein n=1 Tax=Araneus ventricosus TaxID=182803 RepID=A0A4Y2Q993_ARAVE|nr:hypothetical protein AVEN_228425-1 [Araneus ventricosus]
MDKFYGIKTDLQDVCPPSSSSTIIIIDREADLKLVNTSRFMSIVGIPGLKREGGKPIRNILRKLIIILFQSAYTAAGVNEKDQNLRKLIKEISFNLRCSDDTKREGKLLLEFIMSKEKLIFLANGIFCFTKSFLLASASVFLSYNLLLLQLDTKEM